MTDTTLKTRRMTPADAKVELDDLWRQIIGLKRKLRNDPNRQNARMRTSPLMAEYDALRARCREIQDTFGDLKGISA